MVINSWHRYASACDFIYLDDTKTHSDGFSSFVEL